MASVQQWHFVITDYKGDIAAKGSLGKCVKELNTTAFNILNTYAKRMKLLDIYTVHVYDKMTGLEIKPGRVELSIKEKDRMYDFIVRHLKIYGNTFVSSDPTQFKRQLMDDGYDVDIRYVPPVFEESDLNIWQGFDEGWVITLKNKFS